MNASFGVFCDVILNGGKAAVKDLTTAKGFDTAAENI
jgi:hypothetical protein